MPTPKQNARIESLRTALIAIEKAMGKPIKEIARKYQLTTGEVQKSLELAAESGFIDHYKALLYEGCVPQALAVYEAHITMGNLEAARDILFGLGVLQKAPVEASKLKGKLMDSLDDYRQQKMRQQLAKEEVRNATQLQ